MFLASIIAVQQTAKLPVNGKLGNELNLLANSHQSYHWALTDYELKILKSFESRQSANSRNDEKYLFDEWHAIESQHLTRANLNSLNDSTESMKSVMGAADDEEWLTAIKAKDRSLFTADTDSTGAATNPSVSGAEVKSKVSASIFCPQIVSVSDCGHRSDCFHHGHCRTVSSHCQATYRHVKRKCQCDPGWFGVHCEKDSEASKK